MSGKQFSPWKFDPKDVAERQRSAKSFNSTDLLSPNSESPPALSNSRLSIQLKSAPRNKGISGNACLHKPEKNSDLPFGRLEYRYRCRSEDASHVWTVLG